MYAIVLGQQIGRPAGATLQRWLTESGIDPIGGCTWHVMIKPDDYRDGSGQRRQPKDSEIKREAERVRSELEGVKNLKAVVVVGRYGVRLDGDLWRGGIAKSHGHSGQLKLGPDERRVNAIAISDPYQYIRYLKSGNTRDTRQATEFENSCKLVLSRLQTMDRPVYLPSPVHVPRAYAQGLVGLDVETTDDKDLHKLISKSKVEPRSSKLKMVGLSSGQISFEGVDFAPDAEPVAYNLPFDSITTGNWSARWHDPKMLAHLMGERDTEMKSLALRVLGRPLMHYDEAGGTDREPAYCVADATTHLDILNELMRRASPGIKSLYENIERPMFRMFSRWSMEGVFELDREAAQASYDREQDELETLRHAINKLTGGRVSNPNAPEQIAAYVFGWDKASGEKMPSTAESVLAEHRHVKGVPEILEHRERAKRANTYLGSWLRWPFPLLGCLWRPTGAWTGRPSVAALQLHNVPPELRKYLKAREGKRLKSYDNSQLEIRIAAHISQDPNMSALLRGEMPGYEDGDIHRWATDMLGTKNRTFGKIGNFSTLYGGSESAIYVQAAKFGLTADEVRPVARKINQALPQMFGGFFSWASKVKRLPRVPGLFGAVLTPPPSSNESHTEREKVNAPIQRGAVDVVKVQTIALENAGFRTVHQIHDEVIVELDERDDTSDTDRMIREVMENAVRLDVPLKVGTKYWGEKE